MITKRRTVNDAHINLMITVNQDIKDALAQAKEKLTLVEGNYTFIPTHAYVLHEALTLLNKRK